MQDLLPKRSPEMRNARNVKDTAKERRPVRWFTKSINYTDDGCENSLKLP